LGSIIFGHMGDRTGRAYSLLWSVVAMALPSFTIGLLPTYHDIGFAASLLMLICRIAQGLAVGGEYIGSVVFLAGRAPAGARGLATSWPALGSIVGFLLGSAFGTVVFGALPYPEVVSWGWRLPFLFSLVVGMTGFFIRRRVRLDEPPAREGFPLLQALRKYPVE